MKHPYSLVGGETETQCALGYVSLYRGVVIKLVAVILVFTAAFYGGRYSVVNTSQNSVERKFQLPPALFYRYAET